MPSMPKRRAICVVGADSGYGVPSLVVGYSVPCISSCTERRPDLAAPHSRPNCNPNPRVNSGLTPTARPASGPWRVTFNGRVLAQWCNGAEAIELALAHVGRGASRLHCSAYAFAYVGPNGTAEGVR
jgi:hypothetical protein